MSNLKTYLDGMKGQFIDSLPVGVNPNKWWSVAVHFLTCGDKNSRNLMALPSPMVAASLMECASDGLLLDGKEALIVGYGGENPSCNYQRGYKGCVKLIRNSGEAAVIGAEVVYENDTYDAWTDEDGQHFKFRKFRGRKKERGARVCTFAFLKTKDGELYFVELDLDEMDAVRACSKVQDIYDGPFGDEMYKKCGVTRLLKLAPSSTDVDFIMEKEHENFDFNQDVAIEDDAPAPQSRLHESLGIPAADETPEPPAPAPAPEPEPDIPEPPATQANEVTSKIVRSNKKSGDNWSRLSVLLEDERWYGTFSKSTADVLLDAEKEGMAVKVLYTEEVKGDKTFYNIEEVEIVVVVPEEQATL